MTLHHTSCVPVGIVMMNHEVQNHSGTQPIFNCTIIWSHTKQNYYNWSNWANMLVNKHPDSCHCLVSWRWSPPSPSNSLKSYLCLCSWWASLDQKDLLMPEVRGQWSDWFEQIQNGNSKWNVSLLPRWRHRWATAGHSHGGAAPISVQQPQLQITLALGRGKNRKEPAVMLSAVIFRWPGPNFDTFETWIHPVLKHWLGVVSDLSMEDFWTIS